MQHDTLAPFHHFSLALFFGTLFHHLLDHDQLLLCTLSGKICRNISESLLLGQDRPVGFPNKTTTTLNNNMLSFFFCCTFFWNRPDIWLYKIPPPPPHHHHMRAHMKSNKHTITPRTCATLTHVNRGTRKRTHFVQFIHSCTADPYLPFSFSCVQVKCLKDSHSPLSFL